jgi:hypothetical protein
VRRFVERVLGSTVEGYFQTIATNYTALNFFERFDEVRLDLEDRVREALNEWSVEAVRTTLSDFESEDSELDTRRRQIATVRDRQVILVSERDNAIIEKEVRAIQADADAYAATAAQIRLLEEQIRLLSRDHMAKERYLTQLTQMKVPEVVAGDAAQLLQYMPLNRALEIISRSQERAPAPSVEEDATLELPEAEND